MIRGRLIVFEGVDGAGKSTALARVADALSKQGVDVFLPRVGKEHASRPTRMIRQLTRDPRNLELGARAELLLYCAREAQVQEELVRPALERGQTVLVDRSFLTPVVLGIARGLPRAECESVAQLSSAGLSADLTLVFDVHPRTSRLRKRLERVRTRALPDAGRKGLAGSAFKERVREAYAQIASERGYPTFHVERATPDQLAQRVLRVVQAGAHASTDETQLDRTPRWLVAPSSSLEDGLRSLPLAEALFFAEGLIAGRPLRRAALDSEQALVAYTVDAEDPLRQELLTRRAEDALHGWHGRPLSGPSDLRLQALAQAPAAAIAALRYLRDEQSDRIRKQYAGSEPDAVLGSLAGRQDELAWQLRELAWEHASDDARAQSLIGCDSAPAWQLRAALFDKNPMLGLGSLRGTCGERGDALLHHYKTNAPKLVLAALAGRSDQAAHALRDELFETGREVIDSIRRLDDAGSFRLRQRAVERWPSTVAHSLLGLPATPAVQSLYARCKALAQGDLHVLRRLALLDEQAQLPAWARSSARAALLEAPP